MYPLKFNPILKERLWGGNKLGTVLGKPLEGEAIGESWELSGVAGDVSIVSNGELAGTSLTQLITKDPENLLGRSVLERFGKEFPILIKFIDAKKDLSIQLHPSDALAEARHNSKGKTEMWYIMDADEGAELIVGFNNTVTKGQYTDHLQKGRLTELLNYEKVKEGDTFFINTGKIHAIGAGVLLAEIQQTSDITYRVYDFDRRDKDGKLRELHTELALDAIDFEKKDDFKIRYAEDPDHVNLMVQCPYFKTTYLNLTDDFEEDLKSQDSFVIYVCVDGEASLSNADGEVTLKKGETALISADTDRITIDTTGVKFLRVTL
ncbi:MAG: type I phosphomannose isomerase catalytic subunit [Flavobacteriaceae bacterium]